VCTPEPHKVSSTLPGTDHAAVMQAATEFVNASDDEMDVNLYLSLHGMGGVGATKSPEDGAFPWRDKPYMLQVQAWWNPDSKQPEDEAKLIDWVVRFRQALEPYCEGAFINFPDHDQPVSQYYRASWPRLCAVKAQVDPDNRLHFPMGVLPAFMEE
jgi:FAD/FMN-containing dehydrogenase